MSNLAERIRKAESDLAAAGEEAKRLQADVDRQRAVVARMERMAATGRDVPGLDEAVSELAAAEGELTAATARVEALEIQLAALREDEPMVALADEIGELPLADAPLLLLPVRLETRFVTGEGGQELLVRIYPDDIHVDGHEPEITADEEQWGRHFWEETWRAGSEETEASTARRSQAWSQLAQRFDPQRASWIAWTLRPENMQESPGEPLPAGAPLTPEPRFPERPLRADSWTRPPLARALPDRWILLAWNGGRRVVVGAGALIPADLPAGPDPTAPEPETDEAQLVMDDGMRWLVDFDRAVELGMAFRVPVPSGSAAPGFDRLVVMGVRTAGTAATEAAALESLLGAQLYTAGAALLLPDSPTNNSSENDSGFSPRDPAAVAIPPWLRPRTLSNDSDGAHLASLLGIEQELVARLAGADRTEQEAARAMITALWPVTGGYFLEQMIAGTLTADEIDSARRHTLDHVRPEGPLPLLRVGPQPYGLLPVTSLDRWVAREGEEEFAGVLRNLRSRWLAASDHVPRLDRGAAAADPEGEILAVLGGDGRSSEYRARLLFDAELFAYPELHRNAPPFDPLERRRTALSGLLRQLGITRTARLLDTVPAAAAFPLPLAIQRPPPAEGETEPAEYIRWLRESPYETVRDETDLPGHPPPSLLYLLLRHSLLTAYAGAAFRIQLAAGAAGPEDHREPAVVDVMLPDARTPGRTPGLGLPGLEGKALHELTAADHAAAAPLEELRSALSLLESLPPATLERLMAGTIDLFSYRLDAWITSLASRRLRRMRRDGASGVRIGGFGWLEQVRPAPPRSTVEDPTEEGGGEVEVDPRSAGFIHAPSLNQATAAAILRSGALAEQDGAGSVFDVDLSSRRVRGAEHLLDGVRQGQPLRALLGYRFERGLHERHLDRYIEPFRRIAPFGDLLEAQVRAEQTEAEVGRLRGLPHPEAAAADAAARKAQTRLSQLTTESNSLPSRLASAEANAARIRTQLADVQKEIQGVGNQIHKAETARPPRIVDHLHERLADLTGRRISLQQSLSGADAQVSQLRGRQGLIGKEVADARTAHTNARRRADELRGLPHPDLAAAEAAAAEAAERYQALLDAHRRAFLFPSDAEQGALESVAIVRVVDGLALLQRWEAGRISFGAHGLPAAGSSDHGALIAELGALADSVDAMRDVLVAESVFQVAQGKPARAGSTLDSVAGGEMPPPQLEVLRTPVSGRAITHRVLVLMESSVPAAAESDPRSPLAEADPALAAWAERLFGDPGRVRFRVERADGEDGATVMQEAHLSDVPLTPLDLALFAQVEDGTRYPDAEGMIRHHLARAGGAGLAPEPVRLLAPEPGSLNPDEISLQEALDLAHAVGRLLGGARGLRAADLARPETGSESTADPDELRQRADRAAARLNEAAAALDTALAVGEEALEGSPTLRAALAALALFGIREAVPTPETDATTLRARAAAVARKVERRLQALEEAGTGSGEGGSASAPGEAVDREIARLEAVFGGSHPVLPRFRPAESAALAEAFGGSAGLLGDDPDAGRHWLSAMARVRPGTDRLDALLAATEAVSGAAPALAVAQLPFDADARWCALPASDGSLPRDGTLSLVAQVDGSVEANGMLAGLWIDEWVEVIPVRELATGITFHFDDPGAQAPQAILLAVPPDESERWEIDTLEAIVLETLELAAVRAVDPETLEAHTDLDQLLPALAIPLNLQGETISTDFGRLVTPPA